MTAISAFAILARAGRKVSARFDGGALTFNGGVVVLGQVLRVSGLTERFAGMMQAMIFFYCQSYSAAPFAVMPDISVG